MISLFKMKNVEKVERFVIFIYFLLTNGYCQRDHENILPETNFPLEKIIHFYPFQNLYAAHVFVFFSADDLGIHLFERNEPEEKKINIIY